MSNSGPRNPSQVGAFTRGPLGKKNAWISVGYLKLTSWSRGLELVLEG